MMIEKDLCGEFGRLIRGRFRDEYRKSVAKILREKFAEVSEIKRQRDEVTDELTDVLHKLGVNSSAELRLNGGRPSEAGALGSGYGAIIASAASLTREEREDIARRAAGGERIAL